MDARNPILTALAVLVVEVVVSVPTLAGPVYTYSGDFNLPIPADPDNSRGWMDDAVLNVPDHLIIHDIDVAITVTHTNVFDLQIFLQNPAGTIIPLNMYNLDEFFEGANYTDTIFDDEALLPIEQGEAPFTGRFRPIQPYELSAFGSEDAFGLWHLRIYDAFYNDTGTLNSFELTITAPEPKTALLLILGLCLIRSHNHHNPKNT